MGSTCPQGEELLHPTERSTQYWEEDIDCFALICLLPSFKGKELTKKLCSDNSCPLKQDTVHYFGLM